MKPNKEEAKIGHPLRLIKSDLETEILQQEDLSNFVLKCPRCSSLKIVKSGRSNGKQKFQCQDCKRQFVHPLHDSRVVNVAGEVVEATNAELDTNLDLHLIKKNVLAQALSNGSCARPIQLGECPHANACFTCGDFRTTIEFLDQHKTQLEETEKLVQNAEAKGWKRQAEMNIRVRDNLNKIITTLESEGDK